MTTKQNDPNVGQAENQGHDWEKEGDQCKGFDSSLGVILVGRLETSLFPVLLAKGPDDPDSSEPFPEDQVNPVGLLLNTLEERHCQVHYRQHDNRQNRQAD